jgi:hypothetical protein
MADLTALFDSVGNPFFTYRYERNTSNYALVEEWHCTTEKNYNQLWQMTSTEAGVSVHSSPSMGGKALVASSIEPGATVTVLDASKASANASLWIVPKAGTSGMIALAAKPELCLATSREQSPCRMSALPFCDPTLSPSKRAQDLVARLTVEEKVGVTAKVGCPRRRDFSSFVQNPLQIPFLFFVVTRR